MIDLLFTVRLAFVVDGKRPGCFLWLRAAECVHPTKTFAWYLRNKTKIITEFISLFFAPNLACTLSCQFSTGTVMSLIKLDWFLKLQIFYKNSCF